MTGGPAPERLAHTRVFSQADFDAFAALSGDNNPIHVDPAFAATTRFGRPVAHGMLLLAVLDGLRAELRPGSRLAGHDIRFSAPTFADEAMRFELWPVAAGELGFAVTRQADGVATCDGSLRLDAGALAS